MPSETEDHLRRAQSFVKQARAHLASRYLTDTNAVALDKAQRNLEKAERAMEMACTSDRDERKRRAENNRIGRLMAARSGKRMRPGELDE